MLSSPRRVHVCFVAPLLPAIAVSYFEAPMIDLVPRREVRQRACRPTKLGQQSDDTLPSLSWGFQLARLDQCGFDLAFTLTTVRISGGHSL